MHHLMSTFWKNHVLLKHDIMQGTWLINSLLFSAILALSSHALADCTAGKPNSQLPEDTPTSAFTDNGDGTVTHDLTGLIWDHCSLGQTWNSDPPTCDGPISSFNWESALKAAVDSSIAGHLGHTDWRLPNRKELSSITERCGWHPLINRTIFPDTPPYRYWSATSDVLSPDTAWSIEFDIGLDFKYPKDTLFYVRLVRGGRLYDSFDRITTHQLSVNMTGNGNVQSTPPGINCPGACSATFDDASTVDLTASSGFDWKEVGQAWSNGCNTVVGDVCKVIMDADKSVAVTFHCEQMDIPKPVAAVDPSYECAIIKAVKGFEIGLGSDVTFKAETSIELGADGPGAEFKVGEGGEFRAVMP